MPPLSLGDRFFQWLREVWQFASTHPPMSFIVAWLTRFGSWQTSLVQDITSALSNPQDMILTPMQVSISVILSLITGKRPTGKTKTVVDETTAMLSDPAAYLATKINQVSTSPDVIRAINSLTPIISESVIKPMRALALQPGGAPIEAMIDIIAGIAIAKAAMHSVGVASEILSLGAVKGVNSAMESLSEMFPMQEIVAQLVRPIIETGLIPPTERFYNAQFRNARLGAQQLVILNAFGLIDDATLNNEAAEEGWRTEDVEHLKQLARTRVTPGDAIEARDLGQIDDGALIGKLFEFRYNIDDAKFIAELAERRRHQAWSERLFNIALRQFTNYRIDVTKLADIGRVAGFSQERIDVEIAVAKATTGAQLQDLSVSEIEAAFKANKLGEQEVVNNLNKIHLDPSGIPILLETWKASMKAGGTRLNAQKLTEAFHDRIISRDQFLQKLESIGWNPEDARLIIQIAEFQAPSRPRELNEAMIATAFVDGILTRDQALKRLEELGFSKDDAQTILKIHTILPAQKQKELTTAEIAKLFVLGVLPEENVLRRFESMGYTADDAALLFIALTDKPAKVKKSNPPGGKVFKPPVKV